jgi:hypothetical protein
MHLATRFKSVKLRYSEYQTSLIFKLLKHVQLAKGLVLKLCQNTSLKLACYSYDNLNTRPVFK